MSNAPVEARSVVSKDILEIVDVTFRLDVIELVEAQPAKVQQASHRIASQPKSACSLEVEVQRLCVFHWGFDQPRQAPLGNVSSSPGLLHQKFLQPVLDHHDRFVVWKNHLRVFLEWNMLSGFERQQIIDWIMSNPAKNRNLPPTWCSCRWRPRISLSSNRRLSLAGPEALQAASDFSSRVFESLTFLKICMNEMPTILKSIFLTFWRLLSVIGTFPDCKQLNLDQQRMIHDALFCISSVNSIFSGYSTIYFVVCLQFALRFCDFYESRWNANRTEKISGFN